MNLLIINDHQLFAESLKLLLVSIDTSIQTAHTRNKDETIHYLNKNKHPDLILLNTNRPDENNFSLIKQLQDIKVISPILVISATDSINKAQRAINNGALGFISNACDSISFISAIQTVLKGDIYTPYHNIKLSENGQDSANKIHITKRQKEILYLLSQGLLNKQIATELGISTNTVKAHLYDVFRSLEVTNRTAAVNAAFNKGLIS